MIWSIIGSLLSGGATGLIGIFLQRFFDAKADKLKFEHEIAMREADARIMAQEWAARTQVATIEGEAKADVADSAAFAVALASEPQMYSEKVKELTPAQAWMMLLLDFTRGIVRPGLTLYLSVLATAIYIKAHKLMGSSILPFQAYDLVAQIIQTVLYLWTTATLFWFGTRPKKK